LKADDALYSNPYRNIPVEKASSLLIGLWGDDNKLINAVKIEDSNLVRNIFRQIKTSAPEKSKLYTYADYTVVVLDEDGQVIAGLQYWPVGHSVRGICTLPGYQAKKWVFY